MAPGGIGGDPEPLCWDGPKRPGALQACKPGSSKFTTCLFRTAPKHGRGVMVASQERAQADSVSDRRDSHVECDLISLSNF
jgi:hypothetical protein